MHAPHCLIAFFLRVRLDPVLASEPLPRPLHTPGKAHLAGQAKRRCLLKRVGAHTFAATSPFAALYRAVSHRTVPYRAVQGTLFPMCGMNLAFDRELIGPAMYFGLMGEGQPWGR